MQTIKTFTVIGLLIAVCYGAFVALNAPDISIPEELEQWANASGEQLGNEFQIPQFSMPEAFSVQKEPNSWSSAASKDHPEFPSFEDTPSLSMLPPKGFQGPESALPSFTAPNLSAPNIGDPNRAVDGWSVPVVSGAQLTSAPNFREESSTGRNVDGPAIAFNASDLPATGFSLDDVAANDLINAGGALLDSPSGMGSGTEFGLPMFEDSSDSVEDKSVSTDLLSNPASAFSTSATLSSPSVRAELDNSVAMPESLPPLQVSKALALEKADRGNLAAALEMMSQYYERPEIGYAEHTDLVDLLDALSREVIYSDRPLLGSAVTVSAQDTLQSLSERYRINADLLAAINKFGDTQALVPSTPMKVLEGPFRAQISLSRSELTIFLGKMYAGRFPVSISSKNQPPLGTYEIVDRRRDRTFYGTNVVIPATAPTNPFGGYWLSLGGNLSIHGSPEQVTSDLEGAGCISLAPLDAADVYRILGKGSSVEIRP
jgi:hypothetical protein